MADEDNLRAIVDDVVHSTCVIGGNTGQFRPSQVESDIEDLVLVPEVRVNGPWLPWIPKLAWSIEGTGGAVVSGEVEKRVGELGGVLVESVDTLAGPDIPDLGCGVEGTCDNSIS